MTVLTEDPKPVLGFADPIRNAILAFLVLELIALGIVILAERHRARIRSAFEDEPVRETAGRQSLSGERMRITGAISDMRGGRGGADG